ncbi:MAG: hypothetical protein U0132_00030 [Gemmatimonadaceae bacterium]
MASDKPIRRMTLRQLLTHAEKLTRDLIDLIHTGLLARLADYRDLSRPVRRRSHYPTKIAVHNALRKLIETNAQVHTMNADLSEHLIAIQEHANRERVNRM